MLFTPAELFTLLQVHGYFYMFFLMFIEGTIVTYTAAFAASTGIFHIYLVFLVSILGFTTADLVFFFIGRNGKNILINNFLKNIIGLKRVKRIQKYLRENPGRTIAAIKLTPLIPIPGLMLCGTSGIKVKTFLFYSFLTSFTYSTFITILGYYSGKAFFSLTSGFNIEFLIFIALIVIALFLFLLNYLLKQLSEHIQKF